MYMSSPVVDGNHIYGYSNKRKGQLFCLDATTGKVTWTTEGRAGQNASLQSAGADLVLSHVGRRAARRETQPREVQKKSGATRSPTARPGRSRCCWGIDHRPRCDFGGGADAVSAFELLAAQEHGRIHPGGLTRRTPCCCKRRRGRERPRR